MQCSHTLNLQPIYMHQSLFLLLESLCCKSPTTTFRKTDLEHGKRKQKTFLMLCEYIVLLHKISSIEKVPKMSDALPCNTISIFFDFDKDWQVERGIIWKCLFWIERKVQCEQFTFKNFKPCFEIPTWIKR